MGGKGSTPSYSQQEINDAAYAAGTQGQKWSNVTHEVPYGHDQALQSWQQGRNSMGGGSHGAGKPYDYFADAMKGFHMPSGAQGGGDSNVDFQARLDAQYQQQQADLAQAEAERRRIEGENRRDSLYSNYLDAAGTATDYINQQVTQELSNARLLGIDYDITDEQKGARISDYFASIWGEGQQSQLEALMGEWGNPEGFTEWSVVRGDAENIKPEEGEETAVGGGKGQKPTVLADDEEEGLGGTTVSLGA